MAEVKDFVARIRAMQQAKGSVPVQPITTPEPDPDQARQNSRAVLEALGYDAEVIDSIAEPGLVAPSADLDPRTLDTMETDIESTKMLDQLRADGFPVEPDAAEQFITELSKHKGITGLAEIGKWRRDLAEKGGEKAAKLFEAGSTNFNLGMALLDVGTAFDNWAKLQFIPDEARRLELAETMLPTVPLEDPRIQREFHTATEAAVYLIGQKMWGAASDFAATPADWAGTALGNLGWNEAEAALKTMAETSHDVAKEKDSLVAGQIPQLVAGMAPMTSWRDVMESGWTERELDDIYKQFDDHGPYGTAAMALQSAWWAGLDMFGSPSVLVAGIPSSIAKIGPKAIARLKPELHANITAGIAQESARIDDVQRAVQAAEAVTAKAQTAVDDALATGKGVPDAVYHRLITAKAAELRNKQWLSQYSDPGAYEPIMRRPARRNPETITEQDVVQYPLSAGGRSEIRPKEASELIPEALAYRKRALGDDPPIPVDWATQNNIGLAEQRILLGPDDAEYTGDALNLLVRGASIDDVTVQQLAPEYYVLPDVQTSLTDIRKITANQKLAVAERAIETSAATPFLKTQPLRYRVPTREKIEVNPSILRTHETDIKQALWASKQIKDAERVAYYRKQLKQVKRMKQALAESTDESMEAGWMPIKQPTIMQNPGRFNEWLEVAGNRVARSLYPGGLNFHMYDTKLGQALGILREPQRYYASFDPAAWERIRSTTMRFDQSMRASNNLLAREGEAAGILVKRTNFNLKKHFAPYAINKAKSAQLFDVLNTRKSAPEFTELFNAMPKEMQLAHDRMRALLDHFADLQGISDTDRYLQGYIHHMFSGYTFREGARPVEFLGLPAKAEVFAGHLLNRHGRKGYEKDAILALDMYMRAAYKKILMEPLYDDIIKTGTELAKKHKNPTHQTYANDLVSQLKGKPSFLGAKIDEWIGGAWNAGGGVRVPFRDAQNALRQKAGFDPLPARVLWRPGTVDRKMLGLTSLVHTALLTGNPHYPMIQIASGLSTTAGRYGILRTARGLMMMATKEGQQLSKVAGTYKPFVDIFESPEMRKFSEFMASKVPSISPFGVMTNVRAEEISRGITFMAAVDEHMSRMGYKTWKEAVDGGYGKRILFEALRSSEEVNHMYGVLGRSPWVTRLFGSAGASGATQFLSYIPKQTEEIMAQTMREPGRILQYLAMSGWLVRQAATAGIDMTQYLGLGYFPTDASDWTSPAVDAALANVELMNALSEHDPEEVEKTGANLLRMLTTIVPVSQSVLTASKAAERLESQQVRTGQGNLLYNMQMFRKPGEGIGGEFVPTVLMQANLRETLARRGFQAITQEDRRFAYNQHKALDDFVDSIMAGDTEGASRLREELLNVYKIRLTSPKLIDQMFEARSLSQAYRNLEGNEKLRDIHIKIMKEHGINIGEERAPEIEQP